MINEFYKEKEKQNKLEDKIFGEKNKKWTDNQWALLQVRIHNLFKDVSLREKNYIKILKEKISTEPENAQKILENLCKDKHFLDLKVNLIKLNFDLLTKHQSSEDSDDSINLKEFLKGIKF